MVLHAGFALLLSRWSGQTDVVIGTPIANRTREDLAGLIGCFVNTLALRLDLSGNPSGGDLIGRARSVTLDAYAHQDAPFELVVDALGLKRSLTHTPLFQAMMVLQNAPGGRLELPGLSVTPLADEASAARFDVMLTMVEDERRHRRRAGMRCAPLRRRDRRRVWRTTSGPCWRGWRPIPNAMSAGCRWRLVRGLRCSASMLRRTRCPRARWLPLLTPSDERGLGDRCGPCWAVPPPVSAR